MKQTISCPVTVGDVVYFHYSNKQDIYVGEISSISISCNKKGEWKQSYRVTYNQSYQFRDYKSTTNFSNTDIGTRLFLEKPKDVCIKNTFSFT